MAFFGLLEGNLPFAKAGKVTLKYMITYQCAKVA